MSATFEDKINNIIVPIERGGPTKALIIIAEQLNRLNNNFEKLIAAAEGEVEI